MSESRALDVDLETGDDIDPGTDMLYQEASAANEEAEEDENSEWSVQYENSGWTVQYEDSEDSQEDQDEDTEDSQEDQDEDIEDSQEDQDEDSEDSQEDQDEDSEDSQEDDDEEMTEEEKKKEELIWKQRERDYFAFKLKPETPDDRPLEGREQERELDLHKKMRKQTLEHIKTLRNIPYIKVLMRSYIRNRNREGSDESDIDVRAAFMPHPYPL